MKKEIVFCEECEGYTRYNLKEEDMTYTFNVESKSIKCDYKGKTAHCKYCNSEIYVKEINDYNLEKLYEVLNEKRGKING